jgi:hypothetical protein
MKMTPQMPAAANWLLKVFKVPESNPALAGDLNEEYSRGQRAAWLWRQVLAAIAFTIAKEIYSHKLLTIRAFIAGETAVWLSSWGLIRVLSSHWFRLFSHWSHWWLISWIGWVLFPLGSIGASMGALMFAGWIVGRFHREHRTTLVLFFATLQFFLMTPEVSRLLVKSIEQPRFRPYLVFNMALLLVCPIAVLLGGYLARPRAEDPFSPSPQI